MRTAFSVTFKNINYDFRTDLRSASTQVSTKDERFSSLFDYCSKPRVLDEMQQFIGLSDRGHFRNSILNSLLELGQLAMTIPDKSNSRNQKYVRTAGLI
jgi:ATP-dependent DNA helicase RecG